MKPPVWPSRVRFCAWMHAVAENAIAKVIAAVSGFSTESLNIQILQFG